MAGKSKKSRMGEAVPDRYFGRRDPKFSRKHKGAMRNEILRNHDKGKKGGKRKPKLEDHLPPLPPGATWV